MKTLSKSVKTASIAALILATGMQAFPAAAASTSDARKIDTCSRFSQIEEKLDARFEDRVDRFQKRQGERAERLNDRWTEREQKLADHRENADRRRDDLYEKLSKRADTDEEKAAVETFKKGLEEAADARYAAIDKAVSDYRNGVGNEISKQKSAINQLVTTFRNETGAAFDKAESACQTGTNFQEVRKTLKADLKAAREKFVAGFQELGKISDAVKDLGEIRRDAIENATDTFKDTSEQLKEALKSAFGQEE